MTKDYKGKILVIDLSLRVTETIPLNSEMVRNFIGRKGLGGVLLFETMATRIDPLSPESQILIVTGPLTGTYCPSTRAVIIGKSPATGTFCNSYVGGHLGAELKFAGYDVLCIRGKSEAPCYVHINDNRVEFRSANHLWGKDTVQTDEIIKKEVGRDIHIATIGPAGENLVKYSLISVDVHRQAARGGLGAIFGSKNLKALAVKGSGSILLDQPERFMKIAEEIKAEILNPDNLGMVTLRRIGTGRSILFASSQDLYPTRNFQTGTFPSVEKISGETMLETFWVKDKACFGCPINCSKLGFVRSGKYKGTVVEGVEYGTSTLLGANLDIGNLMAIAAANELCDRLGLDTLSTGNILGFVMECFEKGIVDEKDLDGIRLEFGNDEAVLEMIRKIAFREGIGDLLSRGVRHVAKRFGHESEKFAMQVKGLEFPGGGVRASPGMGLAYATAERGADHEKAFPIAYEVRGAKTPDGKILDRYGTEGKAYVTKYDQDMNAFYYSVALCDMVIGAVGKKRCVDLINTATGWEMECNEVYTIGERVWNMIRLFNVREGFSRKDDQLPDRIFREPLTSGIAKGKKVNKQDFDKMLKEYYEIRGWDKNGTPTWEKCQELGLESYYKNVDKKN
jgi:aldehyde:ferredoxin oxidoreductase